MKTRNKFITTQDKKRTAKKSTKKIVKKKIIKKELKPKLEILNIYQIIINNLKNTSQKTKSLFRENEKKKILNFILKSFNKKILKKNSTLILYGQPGTGKTLLINELEKKLISKNNNDIKKKIKFLNKSKSKESLRFVTIFINANNYKSCFDFFNDFFKKLIDLLKINTINFKEQKNKINNNYYFLQKFKNLLTERIKDNLYLFLMIDELESLFIKDKQNFAMIIDFLNIEYSNFIRFAISNVLDLFASFKDQRITANFEYCVFKPYNFNELNGIVRKRVYNGLENYYDLDSFFSFKIIEYFTKKVIKNNCADIRELMRRVLQLFQEKVDFIHTFFPERYILIEEGFYKLGIKDGSKIYEKDQLQEDEIFDVLNRLSFSVQLYVLSIFEILDEDFIFIINEKNIISSYINLCLTFDSNFKTDFNEIKDILVNYGFIKIIKEKKNSILIQSLLNKKRLKTILSKIKGFEVYFSD